MRDSSSDRINFPGEGEPLRSSSLRSGTSTTNYESSAGSSRLQGCGNNQREDIPYQQKHHMQAPDQRQCLASRSCASSAPLWLPSRSRSHLPQPQEREVWSSRSSHLQTHPPLQLREREVWLLWQSRDGFHPPLQWPEQEVWSKPRSRGSGNRSGWSGLEGCSHSSHHRRRSLHKNRRQLHSKGKSPPAEGEYWKENKIKLPARPVSYSSGLGQEDRSPRDQTKKRRRQGQHQTPEEMGKKLKRKISTYQFDFFFFFFLQIYISIYNNTYQEKSRSSWV